MKHLFVPYELAVKLKEFNFHEVCFAKYLIPEVPENRFRYNTEGTPKDYNAGLYGRFISAPLYQQVVDWLLEKHNINVEPYLNENLKWCLNFIPDTSKTHRGSGSFLFFTGAKKLTNNFEGYSDKYLALNAGIEEALKLI